jgi:hypothetical protein
MTSLASAQRSFQDWLLGQAGTASPKVKNADGLSVYHHAYRARLREALGETFEQTWSWIGDDVFDFAVADYVAQYPPSTSSLDRFGDRFVGFLQDRFPDDPEIAEIALIEWTLHICFSGQDAKPVDHASFAEGDWEGVRLQLMPTYAEHLLTTNAAALWRALADGVEPPACSLLSRPTRYRFWRRGFSPHFTAMSDWEACALELVQKGLSFGEVCETMHNESSNRATALRIGSLLEKWFQDELIVAIVGIPSTSAELRALD